MRLLSLAVLRNLAAVILLVSATAVNAADNQHSRSFGRWFADSYRQPLNSQVLLRKFRFIGGETSTSADNLEGLAIDGYEIAVRHTLNQYIGFEASTYYGDDDKCAGFYSFEVRSTSCDKNTTVIGMTLGAELGLRLQKRWYSGALAGGLYVEQLSHRTPEYETHTGTVTGGWLALRQYISVFRFVFEGSMGYRMAASKTWQEYGVERGAGFASLGLGLRFDL